MIVGQATTTVGVPPAAVFEFVLDLERTFDCRESDEGTMVTHREVFDFRSPWRWLVEPLLRRWLESDPTDEMVRFKELVEA